MVDVTVVGCGIVGAAVAFELSRYQISVMVLEKEPDIAMGTTKANSGILHAGYDPKPGTLKAKLNAEGVRLAKALCQQLDVPRQECGSLVVAFSKEEEDTLHQLMKQGEQNGICGLEMWNADALRKNEPQVSALARAALYAKTAAIVSPWEYALALAEGAVQNGVQLRLCCAVHGMEQTDEGLLLHTTKGKVCSRYVVNAAGVHAAQIHNMVAKPAFEIKPSRGEYYLLDKCEGTRVSRIVFQCPSQRGKGVLVAPTVHGNLIVGPNSETVQNGEDVATTANGLQEVRAKAVLSVPDIDFGQNIRCFSGNRARANREDFIIEFAQDVPRLLNVAGIASPGLSAAPAIAKMARQLLEEVGLGMPQKDGWEYQRKRIRFEALSLEEKQALIKKEPQYAHVVCRCLHITEGEVQAVLAGPIPPHTLGSVKRRCGPGMGRCQGGFCSPRILEMLAEHHGVEPTEILQERVGSFVLEEDRNAKASRENGVEK